MRQGEPAHAALDQCAVLWSGVVLVALANALQKFQMVKIITHSPCVLTYRPVRINLDRVGEIFSLPRMRGVGSSFLAAMASLSVSKHRRETQ